MGRQLQFHILPDDMQRLLNFVQKRAPVVVTLRSSDSPVVIPVSDPALEPQVMTLWNKALIEPLERKLIRRPGGKDYYGIDASLPSLELSPSELVECKGKPGLLQGRIYGFFNRPFPEYARWYESIARWIRSNFKKNPVKLGGYVGPAAYAWFESGGYFLPMFLPPTTEVWMAEIEKQH